MKLSDALSGFKPPEPHGPPSGYLVGWAERTVSSGVLADPLSLEAMEAEEMGGRPAWRAEARNGTVTCARLVGGLSDGDRTTWFRMMPVPLAVPHSPAWTVSTIGTYPLAWDGPVKPSTDAKLAACFLRETLHACPDCPRYHCGMVVDGVMTPNGTVYCYVLVPTPRGAGLTCVKLSALRPLSDIPVT